MIATFWAAVSADPRSDQRPPSHACEWCSRTYLKNCRLLLIRYKCRMIRLTDEHWSAIRNHFAEENIADGRPGRKPIPTRFVLEAVLWILNTGAQWHMLPQSYPNYKTVH